MSLGIALPLIIASSFWGAIAFILPCIVPNGPNKWIMQVMMTMTAVCCYLFWIVTFIAQMNPLFGPTLTKDIIILMQEEWKKN